MKDLQIGVSQQEFTNKSEPERSWMLFEAVIKINGEGCHYAKKHYRKMYTLVVCGSVIGGALFMLVKWAFG